jgi:hypothetical protein
MAIVKPEKGCKGQLRTASPELFRPRNSSGWILARSPRAIPIPGFRTVEQVEGLAGAMTHGPLSPEQVAAIDELLDRA